MKNRIKLCLKIAWLTAAWMILLGANLCTSDLACFASDDTAMFLMLLLSFPAGVLSLIASAIILELGSGNYLQDYFVFWLMLTIAGYFQWFVVVPSVFANSELILLNLGKATPDFSCAPQSETQSQTQREPPTRTHEQPRRPRRPKRIAAFDKHGRTPLERALGKHL
jgi:hypothetical protein